MGFFKSLGKIIGMAAPFVGGSLWGAPLGAIFGGIGALGQAGEARDAERRMMAPWNETQTYRDQLLRALSTGQYPEYVSNPYSDEQENQLLGADLQSLADWKRGKMGGLRSDMVSRGIQDSSIAAGETSALEDAYHRARGGARADLIREETTLGDQRRSDYLGRLQGLGFGTLGSQQSASQMGYQAATGGLSSTASAIGDVLARYNARKQSQKDSALTSWAEPDKKKREGDWDKRFAQWGYN